MKWYNCDCCGAEFRVVSESDQDVQFCPHCGTDIDETDDDYYEDEE